MGQFLLVTKPLVVGFAAVFFGISDNTEQYDDAIVDLEGLCKELRILCEEVNDSWTSLTYVLERDGSYNADYEYDVIENYDSRFIMDWQSKYLD